jgi:luciferase family oxidoreductase group 1
MANAALGRTLSQIPLSVLDLAPILQGQTPEQTFKNSLLLAQTVEQLGFTRYWLAEHHNMASVASSATVVLIGYIAGGTITIRVGSGGIMLPNHAPLVVAEQFGTLASLYPGRIDMGLGRAPGTDQVTSMALRRGSRAQDFLSEIQELRMYLSSENSNNRVRAIPGEGIDIPIWILGSSTDSAMLAAALGLPYAFASHFAPAQFEAAITLYRHHFRASAHLSAPYVMAGINVVAADTDEEADRLATSYFRLVQGIITGMRKPLQPPVSTMDGLWTEYEEAAVRQMTTYAFTGGRDKIRKGLQAFIDATGVDELMVVSHIYDQEARRESYRILREVCGGGV